MTNIVIIDDDFDLATMYCGIVNELSGFQCYHIFDSTYDFIDSTVQADVIILDLIMPKISGIDSISLILKKLPTVKIIINSMKEDVGLIISVLKEGANGYLDKYNFDKHIENALQTVLSNEAYLSPRITKNICSIFSESNKVIAVLTDREKDIANGILEGLSYKLIASKYDLSIDTVRMYIKKIYRKFEINSKSELIHKLNAINI